jgi:hypothetical protein
MNIRGIDGQGHMALMFVGSPMNICPINVS